MSTKSGQSADHEDTNITDAAMAGIKDEHQYLTTNHLNLKNTNVRCL
jgi:hypothetical protein